MTQIFTLSMTQQRHSYIEYGYFEVISFLQHHPHTECARLFKSLCGYQETYIQQKRIGERFMIKMHLCRHSVIHDYVIVNGTFMQNLLERPYTVLISIDKTMKSCSIVQLRINKMQIYECVSKSSFLLLHFFLLNDIINRAYILSSFAKICIHVYLLLVTQLDCYIRGCFYCTNSKIYNFHLLSFRVYRRRDGLHKQNQPVRRSP